MKTLFCLIPFFLVCIISSYSQSSGTVVYKHFFNGKPAEDEPDARLRYESGIAVIIAQTSKPSNEAQFIDYKTGKTYQTIQLKDGSRCTTIDSLTSYPKPELTEEVSSVILGFACRKATVVIRSNHIDLWYTTDTRIQGTPALNLGPELGLVLKVVRNGNYEIVAQSIDTAGQVMQEEPGGLLMGDWGEIVDLPTYRQKVVEQNFTTLRIFDREKINFGDTIVNPPDDMPDVTYRYSGGNVILKKVKLPDNLKDNFVFAEVTEYSNGDAYDRTGTVFVIPADASNQHKDISFLDALKNGINTMPVYKSKNGKRYAGMVSTHEYTPPLELMRFITPFGINKYNEQVVVKGIKWEDSVTYKMDITDLLPVMQGEVWIGAFVGNYDKGGHVLSLDLKYHPFELDIDSKISDTNSAKQIKYWIQSIVNTINLMEASGRKEDSLSSGFGTVFMDDTLCVTVDIPKGLKDMQMRFITTGHGGWDGGDEFNQRLNEVFIDNTKVLSYIPWRTDCGTFRNYNPASGNFPIGVSSSDFSRSGWCPGATVNPVYIPIGSERSRTTGQNEVISGRHVIKIFIPMGKPEGTSSSWWNVSLTMVGEFK